MNKVTLGMIQEASKNLEGVIRKTPLIAVKSVDPNLFLKAENLQETGSFKIRGAYTKISSLSDEELSKGIIACSSGNHSQGVALSSSLKNVSSIICMPKDAPLIKIKKTKSYGSEVILVPGVYDDAALMAQKLAEEKDYTLIHPFDDPFVIAGQGTIGLEIIQQLPDVEQVIVPIGGGGLISGISVAIKSLKPECKIIGVQPTGIPSMYGSMKANKILSVPDANTIADGVHVLKPGKLTFELVKENVDDIVTVDEDEICAAIVTLLESSKTITEGAGATSLAAFIFDKVDTSKKTVCLLSGGNVDTYNLERIVTKGLIKLGRLFNLEIELDDNTKALATLLNILAETDAGSIDIVKKYFSFNNNIKKYSFIFSIETFGEGHIKEITEILKEKGYSFKVLS